MYVSRHTIALATSAGGAATAFSGRVTGRILAVIYTAVDFDATADITITLEETGEAILTLTNQAASGVFYPRVPTHDETGAAALYAAAGTNVRDAVAAANDRVKVVVAQGGATKTGTIVIVVG